MALGLVGKLTVMFGADFKGFDKAVKNATKKLDRFSRNANRLGNQLSTNLTLPILAVGAGAVKLASDFEESLNKVNVSFGQSSKEVQAFAKTTLDSFGIAEGSALEMAALFGDMGTSMGLTQKQAAGMSTSLVGLAGDLASFKNIRIDVAQTALASIFTGETESLKKLGVVMTEANLKQFALEQGITKTIKEMSQAEKVQLRYNFVMAQSSNALGDYINTSDGVANSTRSLQESIKELGQQFGVLLIPLAKDLIKSLKGIVDTLRGLTDNQKEAIIFFGKIIAIIGPVIAILGTLAGAISSIITLFAGLSGTALAVILGGIAAAAKYVITRFGGFKKSKENVDNLTGSVKELKDITDKLGNSSFSTFGDIQVTTPKTEKPFSTFGNIEIEFDQNSEKRITGITKKMETLKPVILDTSRAWRTFYENIEEVSTMGISKQEELNAAMNMFSDIMTSAMTSAAYSSDNFFKGFIENIKQSIKQLLIQLAVSLVIKSLFGFDTTKYKSAFEAAKAGVLGLANGGLVTGPTMALVGEGAGTTASNPEVVAPLDKLKGMINGGGTQQVEVFGRISGNDIFLANQRGSINRFRSV